MLYIPLASAIHIKHWLAEEKEQTQPVPSVQKSLSITRQERRHSMLISCVCACVNDKCVSCDPSASQKDIPFPSLPRPRLRLSACSGLTPHHASCRMRQRTLVTSKHPPKSEKQKDRLAGTLLLIVVDSRRHVRFSHHTSRPLFITLSAPLFSKRTSWVTLCPLSCNAWLRRPTTTALPAVQNTNMSRTT